MGGWISNRLPVKGLFTDSFIIRGYDEFNGTAQKM